MNIAFKAPEPSFRSLDAIAEKLLLPTGIDGVYTRTAAFETVVEALSALISRHREPGTEVLRFPPVMSRRQVEKSGYLKSFPHFLGCVCCSRGKKAKSAPRSIASRRIKIGRRRCPPAISCSAPRPVIRFIRSRRAAEKCRRRA